MHIKTSPPFARSQATYTFRQVSWLPAHRSCAFPKVNSVALLQVAPRLQWRHRAGFALLALHRTSLFSQYGHLNAVHNQTAYSIVRNPGSILAQHREKFHPLSQKNEAKGTGVFCFSPSLQQRKREAPLGKRSIITQGRRSKTVRTFPPHTRVRPAWRAISTACWYSAKVILRPITG